MDYKVYFTINQQQTKSICLAGMSKNKGMETSLFFSLHFLNQQLLHQQQLCQCNPHFLNQQLTLSGYQWHAHCCFLTLQFLLIHHGL